MQISLEYVGKSKDLSQGITACDFGGKAISSATFMKTKELA
jgi:hypothetical protein